jgi:hypothetical protein
LAPVTLKKNSSQMVLPMMVAPARFNIITTGASARGCQPR